MCTMRMRPTAAATAAAAAAAAHAGDRLDDSAESSFFLFFSGEGRADNAECRPARRPGMPNAGPRHPGNAECRMSVVCPRNKK